MPIQRYAIYLNFQTFSEKIFDFSWKSNGVRSSAQENLGEVRLLTEHMYRCGVGLVAGLPGFLLFPPDQIPAERQDGKENQGRDDIPPEGVQAASSPVAECIDARNAGRNDRRVQQDFFPIHFHLIDYSSFFKLQLPILCPSYSITRSSNTS